MKGEPRFFVLKREAWLNAAEYEESILGAIVKSPVDPLTNYVSVHEENPDKINMEYHTDSPTDYLLINDATKSEALSASLTKWAGFSLVSTVHEQKHLFGKRVDYRRIKKLDKFWETLKKVETVSRTAIDWVRNPGPWPPCLIVGILICEDAELSHETQCSNKTGGAAELPISQTARATGVPRLTGSVLESKLSLKRGNESTTTSHSKSSGRRIFAVEVRTITTPFLQRRKLRLNEEDGFGFAGVEGPEEDVAEEITAADLVLDFLDDDDMEDLVR